MIWWWEMTFKFFRMGRCRYFHVFMSIIEPTILHHGGKGIYRFLYSIARDDDNCSVLDTFSLLLLLIICMA